MIEEIAIILAAIFLVAFICKWSRGSCWQNSMVFGFGITVIAIGIFQILIIFGSSINTELAKYSGLEYFEKASSILGLPLALWGIGLSMIYQVENNEKKEEKIIGTPSRSFFEPYSHYQERLHKIQQDITYFFKYYTMFSVHF